MAKSKKASKRNKKTAITAAAITAALIAAAAAAHYGSKKGGVQPVSGKPMSGKPVGPTHAGPTKPISYSEKSPSAPRTNHPIPVKPKTVLGVPEREFYQTKAENDAFMRQFKKKNPGY
jgi:hypothetical protein